MLRVLKRNKPCISSAAMRTLRHTSPILVRPVSWPILSCYTIMIFCPHSHF